MIFTFYTKIYICRFYTVKLPSTSIILLILEILNIISVSYVHLYYLYLIRLLWTIPEPISSLSERFKLFCAKIFTYFKTENADIEPKIYISNASFN